MLRAGAAARSGGSQGALRLGTRARGIGRLAGGARRARGGAAPGGYRPGASLRVRLAPAPHRRLAGRALRAAACGPARLEGSQVPFAPGSSPGRARRVPEGRSGAPRGAARERPLRGDVVQPGARAGRAGEAQRRGRHHAARFGAGAREPRVPLLRRPHLRTRAADAGRGGKLPEIAREEPQEPGRVRAPRAEPQRAEPLRRGGQRAQEGRRAASERAALGGDRRLAAAGARPRRGHRQLPEVPGAGRQPARGVEPARDRLQGPGLHRLQEPRDRGAQARGGGRSQGLGSPPRARLPLQGRRAAGGSDRAVPQIPQPAPRRGRRGNRQGRHLLPAGRDPAHPLMFSVSVDLDGLGCYAAIHGLDAALLPERALQAVPVAAVSRLCELFAALRLRATFFAIGGEVDIPGSARALRAAADSGHEIGSHSHGHDYALSRATPDEIDGDLARAERAIAGAVGKAPRGFRAPGYTLSPALLELVRTRRYLYDSSLLPSPPYYAAKAAAIALHALRGRRSRSILGGAGQLFSRRAPHWRGRGRGASRRPPPRPPP